MSSVNPRVDIGAVSPREEERLLELAAEAALMRVELGELPGPAELHGIADAICFMRTVGEIPGAATTAAWKVQ